MANGTTLKRMTTTGTSSDRETRNSIAVLYQGKLAGYPLKMSMLIPVLGLRSLESLASILRTGPIPEMSTRTLLAATDYRPTGVWSRMTRHNRLAMTLAITARLIDTGRVAMIKVTRNCRHHRQSGSASATQAVNAIEHGIGLENGQETLSDVTAAARPP